jgi:alkylhydroperoxidase family enzyme
VTWLPVGGAGTSEREAVLGLLPGPSGLLGDALDRSWSITDSALLELCRRQLVHQLGCRAELPADEPEPASERELAAVAYTEQFLIDQNRISAGLKEAISRHLSPRELCNFVLAVNVHEGYLRVLTLLDIAPDPGGDRDDGPARAVPEQPQAQRTADENLPEGGHDRFLALADPAFWEARMAFGGAMALCSAVDPLTTELCRLRNANHQSCRY